MFKQIKKIFNKQTVIAFMLGAFLFTGLPVMANVTEYIFTQSNCKLIVDGQEYNNPDIPIVLFMKDSSNFAPVAVIRDLCNKLGVPFEYDNDTKEIRITTTGVKSNVTNIDRKEENILSDIGTTTDNYITYEENGLIIREHNGEKYVDAISFQDKYNPMGYTLSITAGITYSLEKDGKLMLENINRYNGLNVNGFKNRNYIKYEDFINKILPLIK